MLFFTMVIFGIISYNKLGVDLYPRVDFPVITVVSALPGADPETIEKMVCEPIEEALATLSGIKHLRSVSGESIAQVIIEFDLKKNVDVAFQEVQARLSGIRSQLPQDLKEPIVEKFDVDSAPIMSLIAYGDYPNVQLTDLIEKEIKEPLQRLSNVGQVKMIGEAKRKLWILPDPLLLQSYNLTLQDVEQSLKREHIELPSGRIETQRLEVSVKTKGEYNTVSDFEQMIVAFRGGFPIRLSSVAQVVDGQEEERSFAKVKGRSAIALQVRRQSGTNMAAVADEVKKEIVNLQPALKAKGITLDIAQDNSVFIKRSVEELQHHLFFGGALAILIVFLFLRSIKSTLVCSLSLPLSILGTFGIMHYLGFTQNMMTLLALTIAIGLLIDDAIVVQENISRHLHLDPDPKAATLRATKEIFLAVLATTFTAVAVFIPVAFMEGIVGRFFYQFGVTVSCAVLISMLVSFTLNPMFSVNFFTKEKQVGWLAFFERFLKHLEEGYAFLLTKALRRRWIVVLIALFAFVGAIYTAKWLRFEFVPMEDQSEFMVHYKAPEGTSLTATKQALENIEQGLQKQPWVDYILLTVGGSDMRSVSKGNLYVKMTEKDSRAVSQFEAMKQVREELAKNATGTTSVEMAPRMSGGGQKATEVQLEIHGPDMKVLDRLGTELAAKMALSPGFVDIDTSSSLGKPQASIAIRRERAADLGISPVQIATALRTALGGSDAAKWNQDAKKIDVAIRLPALYRTDLRDLETLFIRSAQGQLISLGALIDIHPETGPVQIEHHNRKRQVTVSSNLDHSKKVLGEAMQELTGFIGELKLPAGYTYNFAGQASNFKESMFHLVFALGLAIVMVYIVLASQFESFLQPLVIMLALPLSIIGAIGALVLFQMTMSIFTMIGIIMLMGLVTKNGILLVDFANLLQEKLPRGEALVQAGRLRLQPILMTTLAVILGMLPVALSRGAGSETRAPMAMAVIGGLITSTFLTLVVIPVAYDITEGWKEKKFNLLGRAKSLVLALKAKYAAVVAKKE